MDSALAWPTCLSSCLAMESVDSNVPYRSKAMMVFSDAMVLQAIVILDDYKPDKAFRRRK